MSPAVTRLVIAHINGNRLDGLGRTRLPFDVVDIARRLNVVKGHPVDGGTGTNTNGIPSIGAGERPRGVAVLVETRRRDDDRALGHVPLVPRGLRGGSAVEKNSGEKRRS